MFRLLCILHVHQTWGHQASAVDILQTTLKITTKNNHKLQHPVCVHAQFRR